MKRFIFPFLILLTLIPIYGKAQQNCTLSVQGTVEEVSCSGGMDGAIRLQVSGGTKPYIYYWSNGQEVKDISQLTEGIYTVTVRDPNGCEAKEEFSIKTEDNRALVLKVEQMDAGAGMKVLRVSFENGKKPMTITSKKISDGIRTPVLEYSGQALNKGTYWIEAFTEAGCSAIQKIIINAN